MFRTNQGIIRKIRKSKAFRGIAVLLMLSMLFETAQPTVSLALTEGPSQPEVQSFEPIGTTDMVDLFTGDFNYNIPLFNLPGPNGGYPVNIAYHAGATADDEASWVGLGWNINVGSLVRNMRGLPDEFMSKADGNNEYQSGDYLEVKQDMKQNVTVGVHGQSKTEAFGAKDQFGISTGASIYYNNYRGLGMSSSATFMGGSGDVQGGIGLSLDSENGLGVSALLTLSHHADKAYDRHQLSLTFDGDLSIDYSLNRTGKKDHEITEGIGKGLTGSVPDPKRHSSYSSGISYARNSFNPSLSFRTINWNFSGSLSSGAENTGFFTGGQLTAFFNTQDFSNEDKKGRKHLVAGYDKVGSSGTSQYYTRDFERTRDGQVTKGTQFLPASNYTYDTYASTGQGMSGYFRPRRNEVGRSFDPYVLNNTYGGSIAFEAGGPDIKGGIDGGVNFGWQQQGPWQSSDNNELAYEFSDPRPVSSNVDHTARENLYYQAHGEMNILEDTDIGYLMGLDLPKLKFAPKGTSGGGPYGGKRYMRDEENTVLKEGKTANTPRNKRNTLIHNLLNKEVAYLKEFEIRYYEMSESLDLYADPTTVYNRESGIANHYAGYKVLNESGSYYVYGLPAYNHKETENLYSVDPTPEDRTIGQASIKVKDGEVDYKDHAAGHQFIRKTTKSPYAHSYLLTSVLGADYVDLTDNGASDDDLGYWVKFDYIKHIDDYKWRTPFDDSKGFFNEGARYTDEDNKASYSYGEKELWYLGRIETKSHIAIFVLEDRQDMAEARSEMNAATASSISANRTGKRLKEIRIYEKKTFEAEGENAVPLQTVHFGYEYLLCGGTPNSKASGQKKLTLTKLWFTSNGSTRGELNQYKFDYQASTPAANPNYQLGAYDSWGVYKPKDVHEHAAQFPYVNQFNQDWVDGWEPSYANNYVDAASKELTKTTQDQMASVWCLKRITLPSGGQIKIEYESDDYGYVQHKTANQMFRIESFAVNNAAASNNLYGQNTAFINNPENRRIYFKLEEPLSTSMTDAQIAQEIFSRYVEPIHKEGDSRNLYFKARVNLTDANDEYVSGYLPLEDELQSPEDVYHYGVATSTGQLTSPHQPVNNSHYQYGYVTLKAARKIRKPSEYFDYHPMALAAWTFMQTDAQELLHHSGNFDSEINSNGNLLQKIGDFVNIAPMIAESFGGIRKYCKERLFANSVDLDYSCIRLASPDKIKYGGGHRVKKLSIFDNWSGATDEEGTSRTYGQEFTYTTEENGRVISSGVASYEPQAGGDENALKYPYFYSEQQTMFTRNNLFAEAPFNENLFPGSQVGYSKVTVKSINTALQEKNAAPGGANPTGRTGGVTVHEFYTAKDFPTRVEWSLLAEENSTKDVYNLSFPIPLIGSISYRYYHGTQAYKIELNDMHGKPKSVRAYQMNNYVMDPHPITESEYEYQCHEETYMGEKVLVLDNEVPIIKNDDTYAEYMESGNIKKKLMGVEVDVFTDQRESKAFSNSAGIDFNVDVPPFLIPVPSVWPSYSNSKSLFRTYVTNKVVHRSGILKRTKVRDLQNVNESEIIAYDERSGQPLLTRIKNEFGDDFYSYNIPAYYIYDGMGHAYRNINYQFDIALEQEGEPCYYTFDVTTLHHLDNLVRGDELLLTDAEGDYAKGWFLGWLYSGTTKIKGMIHMPGTFASHDPGDVNAIRVIRSGRRNHYATMAANYVTKGKMKDNGITTTTIGGPAVGTDNYTSKRTTNVLSATAAMFRDDWFDDNLNLDYHEEEVEYERDGGGTATETISEFFGTTQSNPYKKGNSGIWRPYKQYTYTGTRTTSGEMSYQNPDEDPRLFEDGMFQGSVALFSWDLGNPEYYTATMPFNNYLNWEWTNEITRFSTDAYELENVNRLGIFSSALYGYDNSLTIGVGGNASYRELAVMDFETLPLTGGSEATVFGRTLKQTNFSFYDNATGRPQNMLVNEQLNIQHAEYSSSNNTLTVTLEFTTEVERNRYLGLFGGILFSQNPATPHAQTGGLIENAVGLTLMSKKVSNSNANLYGRQSYLLNGKYEAGSVSVVGTKHLACKFTLFVCDKGQTAAKYLPDGSIFFGKMNALLRRPVAQDPDLSKVFFVGPSLKKAHSGKQCMKLEGSCLFDQPKIKLIKDKKYVYSMWISRDNTDVKTYQIPLLIQVAYMDGTNHVEIPGNIVRYGKVIEGWQKVDVEFSVPENNMVFALKFNPGSSKLYIDDVRLSPKTGGLVTYVYDQVRFRLMAQLNVDNYATLYFYDEEGNLHLSKQETEEGIFTISESRGHKAIPRTLSSDLDPDFPNND